MPNSHWFEDIFAKKNTNTALHTLRTVIFQKKLFNSDCNNQEQIIIN